MIKSAIHKQHSLASYYKKKYQSLINAAIAYHIKKIYSDEQSYDWFGTTRKIN